MQVQTYLNFDGRCEEAVEFYRKALGAQVEMMLRMKDSPEPVDPSRIPPGSENKIMHTSFRIGDTTIQASDFASSNKANFQGFSLALRVKNAAEATRYFNALSDGGKVQTPLIQTFFSPRFGVVTDRFGVSWMVLVQQ